MSLYDETSRASHGALVFGVEFRTFSRKQLLIKLLAILGCLPSGDDDRIMLLGASHAKRVGISHERLHPVFNLFLLPCKLVELRLDAFEDVEVVHEFLRDLNSLAGGRTRELDLNVFNGCYRRLLVADDAIAPELFKLLHHVSVEIRVEVDVTIAELASSYEPSERALTVAHHAELVHELAEPVLWHVGFVNLQLSSLTFKDAFIVVAVLTLQPICAVGRDAQEVAFDIDGEPVALRSLDNLPSAFFLEVGSDCAFKNVSGSHGFVFLYAR